MVGERKPPNTVICTKDLTKVSLAEFLRYYEQAISEEQAWAICFQSCCKMNQMLAQGLDSLLQMVVLDVDNLYIHSDGSVSFSVPHNSDDHICQQSRESLEDKLAEELGMLIYKALDWGIESHLERDLSESLEKLIRFLVKIDTETAKTAVTFQDVIKLCEDHFLKPSEAASHYTMICKLLFAEYSELQKLMVTIQSCKKYLGTVDAEDCSAKDKAKDWVGLWQNVLGDLRKGVRLHKFIKQPRPETPTEEGIRSSYSTVVDDIKNKRYALHKASTRKLKDRPCQEPSLHDQLMMEVRNPPKLQPTFKVSSGKYKEEFWKFTLNAPCDRTVCGQNISTRDFSKAKKAQLNCIPSDPELKKSSMRWSLPTIADLMGTRCSEIKDCCQKDIWNVSSRAQVCLICHNPYFIWPYVCHLCSRVICTDCCTKMSMPVRPCVRLPLNLFVAVQFGREDMALKDQKIEQLLHETENWVPSKIPLVFEPHCSSPPLVCHTKSMMDWPFMDICIKCEQYLLRILSLKPPCRKRSLSWTELK
ncbi:protein spire homolog 1 isoform X1 [Pogona vitticeps]